MKQLLQFALLLTLAVPVSHAQIYLRVNQSGVTNAINNGGSVTVNAPALRQTVAFSVSITYAGPGQLRFSGAPRLAGSPDFTLDEGTPTGTTLNPGQSVVVPIRFLATTPRVTSAQTSWEFTETVEATRLSRTGAIVVGMNGTAPSIELGYVFSLNGNFNPVPLQEGILPFPVTPLHAVSTASMTLLNRGTGQSQIEGISVTGSGFTVNSLPILPAVLNAGGVSRFEIRFQPRTEGEQQGTLTIQYGGGQTIQVSLRGNATTSYLTYRAQSGSADAIGVVPNGTVVAQATEIGQRSQLTIRFTNTSQFDITVPGLALSGEGWVITDAPITPFVMFPDSTQSLTITFAPVRAGTAMGRLRIGADAFELRGEAQGSDLQYRYSSQAGEIVLQPSATITFPNAAIGETRNVTMTLTNKGTAPAAIMTIAVPAATQNGFSVSGLPPLPYTLGAGQNLEFSIQFKAGNPGPSSGNLLVNSAVFGLFGAADPLPELPEVILQGPTNVQAFEQPRLSVNLSRPYPVALRGTLTLAVESDGFAIDPTAQFSTGGRSVLFTVPAGSLRATFSTGMPEIRFQTGSVASAFIVTASFATTEGISIASDSVRPLRIGLAAGAPKLLSGGVQNRGASNLTLEFIGVTTTRSLTRISVKVKGRNGYQLANTEYTQDVTGPSLLWFYSPGSAGYGGQFVATLPMQLSANGNVVPGADLVQAIESITVTFQNERGTSDPVTVQIQ